jgi:hypothetical protein
MAENPLASVFISIIIGLIIWIYAMIRTYKSEFHNPKLKKVWIIALILFPPSALLFPFIGDKQTK